MRCSASRFEAFQSEKTAWTSLGARVRLLVLVLSDSPSHRDRLV